jgi:hypothetical protein
LAKCQSKKPEINAFCLKKPAYHVKIRAYHVVVSANHVKIRTYLVVVSAYHVKIRAYHVVVSAYHVKIRTYHVVVSANHMKIIDFHVSVDDWPLAGKRYNNSNKIIIILYKCFYQVLHNSDDKTGYNPGLFNQ